ncbi:MAG TPA: hypothetical protein VF292_05420 [Rhodanobacteraceae bacterium]
MSRVLALRFRSPLSGASGVVCDAPVLGAAFQVLVFLALFGNPLHTRVALVAAGANGQADPLLVTALAELTASNRHDLGAFLRAFAKDAVILTGAPPYAYSGRGGLTVFFCTTFSGAGVSTSSSPARPRPKIAWAITRTSR